MTTLLILTGPQGAGNHLFAKLFSQHPDVNGWAALLTQYWQGHDQEPFVNLWRNPKLIKNYNWNSHKYHVTSISCPYRDNGKDTWPDYETFIQTAQDCGIIIKVAVIGRDQNILSFQEQRVRGRITYTEFLDHLPKLIKYNPLFLSQELLYLYKEQYTTQLSQYLDFPIEYNPDIVKDDANTKYFVPIESNWLDYHIKVASSKHN
jgi:hypothetical protein